MITNFIDRLRRAFDQLDAMSRHFTHVTHASEHIRQALGRIEERQIRAAGGRKFKDVEFKVYSQWGEDGIIQHLLREVRAEKRIFVEFGVEDYSEANTRFLLAHDNWSGLVIDGNDANVTAIRRSELYWRYNLKAAQAFVTRENINDLLRENGVTGEIGLLSIDIDGNDYWVWEAIDAVTPSLVIVEYNSRFGAERAVTVPYDPKFVRKEAHHSCVYYGASLPALIELGHRKGYAFVGSNTAGNNAFFVRRDLLPSTLHELSAAEGYVALQFHEARDARGKLAGLSLQEEAVLANSLPLVEVPL